MEAGYGLQNELVAAIGGGRVIRAFVKVNFDQFTAGGRWGAFGQSHLVYAGS
jgi:hypothetical protein